MKKRIISLLLAMLLMSSATACAKKKTEDSSTENSPAVPSTVNMPEKDPENPQDTETNDPTNQDGKKDPNDTVNYDPDSWVNPGSLTSHHAIVNAAAKASPSVVAITTEVVTYGGFYGNYVSEGAGSGVIYSSDGYIITNNHVIENADTVRVTLVNGDTYDATVIGADTVTDIAVLKINVTGLSAATPENTDLQVGQPVIAIGNPMGTLSGTVTSGIVSALSRTITVEGVAMELLQFDAAVSPGNSGGGLFDINGNLVAIVNAKSSGDGVEGISFAIPVTRALEITKQFIENGYISGRPDLGIEIECITSTNYESFRDSELWNYATIGTRVYPGIYVTKTDNVTYANTDTAFQFGDRITQVGNTEIADESDLTAALSAYNIGDTITVRVARLTQTSSMFGSNYAYKSVNITIVLQENKAPSSDNSSDNNSDDSFGGGTII